MRAKATRARETCFTRSKTEGFMPVKQATCATGTLAESVPLSRSAAFTLIELLVILAILAILATILFPVFSKSREKSRQATCVSNQKQMGIAMLQYAQDYNEMCVPYSVGGITDSPAFIWDRIIQPYHKSESALRCPSAGDSYATYSYSAVVGGAVPRGGPPRALSTLESPSKTIVICETAGSGAFTSKDENIPGWSWSFICPDERGSYQGRSIKYGAFVNGLPTGETKWVVASTERAKAGDPKANIHGNGSNYAFADGHAKWLPYFKNADGRYLLPKTGLDYDSDGIAGNDPNAKGGSTQGLYD